MKRKFKSIVETHPALAQEWHEELNEITSKTVSAGSNVKAWWQCKKDGRHVWEAAVQDRTSKGSGCPVCSGRKIVSGLNDLRTLFPEIAKSWSYNNDLKADEVSPYSKKKYEWVCSLNHYWESSIEYQTQNNSTRCPVCSGRKVLEGFNDLKTLHPEIAEEWSSDNELLPTQVSAGSNRKIEWVCDNGHKWSAVVWRRTKKHSSCPICLGKELSIGHNDLKSLFPEIAEEWAETNAENAYEVLAGSKKKYDWICKIGHTWEARIQNRTRGQNCPTCTGRKVLKGFNDLASFYPDLVEEWSSANILKPEEVTVGSSKKVFWECKLKHEWEATVCSRTGTREQGCPKCSRRISKAEQDLHDYVVSVLPENTTVEQSNRSIIDKELDIYIPEKKIAIEYNGLYWHTEKYGKDKWYHHEKYEQCRGKGIQLITIWEDDWNRSPLLIKKMIAHKIGASTDEKVPGRKTFITQIHKQEALAFYTINHIQGHKDGTHFGLRIKETNELVAVSTWRKDRSTRTVYLERYATNKIVQGGFTKLLKNAVSIFRSSQGLFTIKEYDQIVTFSDNSVSDGGLYRSHGFTLDRKLEPDYTYFAENRRVHKFNYRLKRFRNDPELEYKEGLTEKELAKLNGLERIWDYGKIRWILEI